MTASTNLWQAKAASVHGKVPDVRIWQHRNQNLSET